jgi:hypothetical protein
MHQFGIHIQFRITEFHIVATFLQCLKQWGLLVHPLAVIIKGFIIFIPVSGQREGYVAKRNLKIIKEPEAEETEEKLPPEE